MGGGGFISVYAPGATTPTRIIHPKETVTSLTVASNGTLYAATYNSGILIYGPGKEKPKNSIRPEAQVAGLALGPANQ